MKKVFISIFLFLLFLLGNIDNSIGQTVTIPDPNFATYLQAAVGSAINGNQLDTSKISVKTLKNIYAPNLNISDFSGIQYFPSLKFFVCTGNSLITLPPLPDSITDIVCSQNKITSLPPLPKMLQELWCDNNKLISLPSLPNNLINLYCFQNELTSIPSLPNSIKKLSCSGNLLSVLPYLTESLVNLDCSNNELTDIPVLPDSLQFLDAHNNKITCFPVFPSSIKSIYIFKNPFCCLPNFIPAMNAPTLLGQPLSTYPLCNIDNSNGCSISKDVPTTIIIPNIFTPNADNINDTFLIKGIYLNNFSCKIFDRWGGLIYQWNNINSGWNGKDRNGTAALDGTYFYSVSYTDNTGKSITKNGFFQLLK